MMKKLGVLAAVVLMMFFFSCVTSAQDIMTQRAGAYLVKVKEIDSAIYRSKTKSKGNEVVTNFYVDEVLTMVSNNQKITFYKFGSYTEHQRPHFALVKNNDFDNICFVDCADVDAGISTLLTCLRIDGFDRKELQAFKAKAIKHYINGFPAASGIK